MKRLVITSLFTLLAAVSAGCEKQDPCDELNDKLTDCGRKKVDCSDPNSDVQVTCYDENPGAVCPSTTDGPALADFNVCLSTMLASSQRDAGR